MFVHAGFGAHVSKSTSNLPPFTDESYTHGGLVDCVAFKDTLETATPKLPASFGANAAHASPDAGAAGFEAAAAPDIAKLVWAATTSVPIARALAAADARVLNTGLLRNLGKPIGPTEKP